MWWGFIHVYSRAIAARHIYMLSGPLAVLGHAGSDIDADLIELFLNLQMETSEYLTSYTSTINRQICHLCVVLPRTNMPSAEFVSMSRHTHT